ncbi:uncharacterized protein G2W53_012218 [Senna tora]|uniref:Uncharacterized protein n=1 Tax=Senna tora TaxID=362788 RepID=A0A834U141_9FABA|nr:uncharacterized protein G2W53_012218 [Senna tora]
MAMGYEHYNHHRFQHQKLHIHERTTFLPMLCSRPSIKDASLPRWRDPPASVSDDHLSPRIGCMGQVKRNNKIVGFPPTKRTTISTSPAFVKYSKLKKLFSGKNYLATAASVSGSTSRTSRAQASNSNENGGSLSVSIENMDPPLPVIKNKCEEERQMDSLWKRRSGGLALKTLQLQQIHHPTHHLQPTTV